MIFGISVLKAEKKSNIFCLFDFNEIHSSPKKYVLHILKKLIH